MTQIEHEFSRVVVIDDIPREGLVRKIEAEPEERAALAQRFGLIGLDQFSAELRIRKSRDDDSVTIDGQISANVTQECVRTLEPVEAVVKEDITERFVKAPDEIAEEIVMTIDDDEDFHEHVLGDTIDIGEVVSQCLFLELDPYPRKPGTELSANDEDTGSEVQGPFAILAKLKQKDH